MIIKRCKDCPFLEVTVLSIIATLGAKAPGGVCSYDAKTDRRVTLDTTLKPQTDEYQRNRTDVWARLKIKDAGTVPPECPLRVRDITITLGD